jgi:phosphocarrier protein HPr
LAMEIERVLRISNSLGLHARAAAKIIEMGKRFDSRLYLRKNDQEVEGDGILSILMLSCPKGTRLKVRIEGEDAGEFMESLERLFENKFGEGL